MQQVMEEKKFDVVLCTDAKNEADDQYALVHSLLSPRLRIHGLVASHFGKKRSLHSMEESYEELLKIADLMNFDTSRIFKGNSEILKESESGEFSQGAKKIVEIAHKVDKMLYVGVMGPLSDVAAALLMDESIAEKICVVWTGTLAGMKENDLCREANARNDSMAVNIVMRKCKNLIIIPYQVYSTLQISLAELEYKISDKAVIGRYLFDQLLEVNSDPSRTWTSGESWCLGDNAVSGILVNPRCYHSHYADRFMMNEDLSIEYSDGKYEEVTDLDTRFIFEDMFAKIALYAKIK